MRKSRSFLKVPSKIHMLNAETLIITHKKGAANDFGIILGLLYDSRYIILTFARTNVKLYTNA